MHPQLSSAPNECGEETTIIPRNAHHQIGGAERVAGVGSVCDRCPSTQPCTPSVEAHHSTNKETAAGGGTRWTLSSDPSLLFRLWMLH